MTEELLETKRRIVTSFDEVREATLQVASRAQRAITVLTPDLEPALYEDEEFLEAIKRLVLARSYSRVRVLISDPSRAVRTGNHFVALARRLNTYIDIRNLREDYRGKINDAYIIADETAVLYRSDGRALEGIIGSHEPAIAKIHLDAFAQPWEDSVFRQPARA
jgi:hypothetical protein